MNIPVTISDAPLVETAQATTVITTDNPSRITTTLYDLFVALQDSVDAGADWQVIAVASHLLSTGRVTFLKTPSG